MAKTAVIVEDSKIAALAIKRALENLEYNVVSIVENGEEAVAKCRELSPDLITMDLNMPKMNGIDATQQLLSSNAALNILVITERQLTDQERAQLNGVLEIVMKPVTEEKIRLALENARI